MVGITASDYASESKRLGAKRRTRKDQRVIQVKVKLPTQLKSKKMYCRNCLMQLESKKLPIICKQCGKLNVKPLWSRK